MAKALTATAVEKARAVTSRLEVPDGLLSGLYLIVQPSGAKSWAIRFRSAGRPRKFTIGSYPGISLAAARSVAQIALRAVAEGRDPTIEKKEARKNQAAKRNSVEAITAQFIDRQDKAGRRASTLREARRILNAEILPAWRERYIGDITKRDIIELLDHIADRGAQTLANRVLALVRRLFNWCIERDILQLSPCAGLKPPSAERSRERVLSELELRSLWNACDSIGWPFGPLIQLLVLTAQRRDEVASATFAEFDLEANTWTIPRERAKSNRTHLVPLAPLAVKILKSLPVIDNNKCFIFSTNGRSAVSGFSRAKVRIDQLMQQNSPDHKITRWTLHDLRRTAATGIAQLGFPPHVVEAALNHRSGTISGIAAVYNRHSHDVEKRMALETWAQYVFKIVEQARAHQGAFQFGQFAREMETNLAAPHPI